MNEIIKGTNIFLQPLTHDNLLFIYELYQDDNFMIDFGKMSDDEKTYTSVLKWYEDCLLDEDVELFAIYEETTNQIIGYIQLDDAMAHDECVWLVIGIGPDKNQNKGYGTESLELIINHLFFSRAKQTIRLAVLNHNDRAIKVYQKLGFEIEVNFPVNILRWSDAFYVLQMKLTRQRFNLIKANNKGDCRE